VLIHWSGYIFVFITLAGALLAVFLRDILRAVFGLALGLLGLAGLFVYLGSPFVAAMEVLIYVGGISVAMVFAVMFSHSLELRQAKQRTKRTLVAAMTSLVFVAGIGLVLRDAHFTAAGQGRDWSVRAIGRALLTHYNLVFEALSVVLLLAILGAIIIARREQAAE